MKTELIAAVRAHAVENYNSDGWDVLVECWSDEEIDSYIDPATTEEEAIANCRRVTKIIDERRREVQECGGY